MDRGKSKLAVVTGGAGFIGSHLCERLVKEGYKVISLDNYFTGSKENHVEGVEYREGHTKDIEQLISETPDIIFHLGEYSRVEQSIFEPLLVHDLNILGTEGVLQFWKKTKGKLIYAGSSTKFGDNGSTRNTSPYASTKAENSEKVRALGEKEALPYAITYFYNVYGPRERAGVYGTVVENFKSMYLRGVPFTVTSPGTQERNFTHVLDIVDGLFLVALKGQGDEYGLGNKRAYSILQVAHLFSANVVMLPERKGNRMQSSLDTAKAEATGWQPSRQLEAYIDEFVSTHPRAPHSTQRVLIYSTTFHPISGPAETALLDTMKALPSIQFDVITTRFIKSTLRSEDFLPHVHVHRVGLGTEYDKFLLPFLATPVALHLLKKNRYIFVWGLMASYAAIAGFLGKKIGRLPLLVTLADQQIQHSSPIKRRMVSFALTGADQIYGNLLQEDDVKNITNGRELRRSMGDGDAFANAVRFAYETFLNERK